MENEQSNEILFSYQTKVSDMYRFLMQYSYSGMRAVVNLVISIGAIVLLCSGADGGYAFNKALLIIIAALFTVIQPVLLYYKAAKQVKLTPMFQQPLDYTINDTGVTVRLKEEEMVLAWEDVYKIVETKKDFYFYMSFNRAHILPKEGFADQCAVMRELIRKNAKGIVKIKK
ncbi:MAG: YcxB family protein [Clostridiales bacterium]|nr:YcxB family protein [Clostridiales bacterium]